MQNLYLSTAIRLFEPMLGSTSGNPNIQAEFVQKQLEDAAKKKEELACIRTQTPESPTPAEVADAVERTSTVFFSDKRGLFLFDYQVRGFIKEATLALIELGDCAISKWAYKKACDSFIFVLPRRVYLLRPSVVIDKLPNRGMWEEAQKITKWEKDHLMPIGDIPDASFKEWCYQRVEDTREGSTGWAKIDGVDALERPLRGQTQQGERIALARSEKVEEGAQLALTVLVLAPGNKRTEDTDDGEEDEGKKKKPRKSLASFDLDHIRNCLDYGSRKGLLQWRGGGWGRINWRELK